MNNIIQMPKRNVQHATLEQLKREWKLWAATPNEDKLQGCEFHYEEIYWELNRRGEGAHCAV